MAERAGQFQETRPRSAETPDLGGRIRLLSEAYDYAHDVDCDVWDFAVEISSLRSAGFSDSELRWLICKGFVTHRGETTFTGERRRTFRGIDGLKFCEQSCFALTVSGREFAWRGVEPSDETVPLDRRLGDEHIPRAHRVPAWDSNRHELLLDQLVVKHFKLPAPNQEAVLMAFEEELWATRIDDPIPPANDQDPKQRLRDTIKSLNRNQKHQLIRFSGDGSGQGVLWELIDLPS